MNPDIKTLKFKARLENWTVESYGDNLYLWGFVYDHPSCHDGQHVQTTAIKGRQGECIVTKNTVYTLGKMSERQRKEDPHTVDNLYSLYPDSSES